MLNIYKITKYIAVTFCLGAIIQSCNIINPKEPIPTYIHIDSVQFDGAGTHEITSIVVYYNNNPVGSFDLPATFPIVATGTGSLLIAPGVNSNGQSDRMTQYPFYTQDTSSFVAQPGKIINYTPRTTFVSSAKFHKISDFEYGQIGFSKSAGNVGITEATDPASIFEGNGTGSINLTAVGDSSVDSSNGPFAITNGAAFIEFDYKNTCPFALAMQAYLPGSYTVDPYYIVGVVPSQGVWRKFYLNVTGYTSTYPATAYYLYLNAFLSDGMTSGRLLIDNVKLVTF
jgi:hypothetical protein